MSREDSSSLRKRLEACLSELLSLESRFKDIGCYGLVAREIGFIRDFSSRQTADAPSGQSVAKIEELTRKLLLQVKEIESLCGRVKF